jgi:carbamoyl-phosphate synthase large subunit
MRKQCRVLVTGAGSGVGQGVIKALRISGIPVTIVAADISPMNVALYLADEAIIIPRVEGANALDVIIEILDKYRIDVVMIGSEFDLEFFAVNKEIIKHRSGAQVIVSPAATVAIANDKWLTAEFLRMNNLPYAEAYLPESLDDAMRRADQWGYPVVLKTRRGTSSRHVYIIQDRASLEKLYLDTPIPMLQRMIDTPSDELGCEYTCSVFKDATGNMVGPFTARRTVRGGTSWHIEVAQFDALNESLLAIAGALDFSGSLNIQLMLTSEGAIPFELNSRFSGTTAVRAYFGFNEPAMALHSFFYGEQIPRPTIRSGVAMRYHEEVFIEGISSDTLNPGINKGIVVPWF